MPLTSGQSLSFYQVLGPLGAGGMGEVYRAQDTRLEREVAIKVYRRGTQMFAVSFEVGPDPKVGVPRLLFDRPYRTSPVGRSNPNYDVAADGRFLMIRVSESAQVSQPVVHVTRGLADLSGQGDR